MILFIYSNISQLLKHSYKNWNLSWTDSVHQLIWRNSSFWVWLDTPKFFKLLPTDSVLKKLILIQKIIALEIFFSLTWSFLQTYSAYGITWNFSKLFSSISMLKNISTVRRPTRGHRNGSKKITKFHSLNMLLKQIYFLPKLIRFMKQMNYFKKLKYFANWFNL